MSMNRTAMRRMIAGVSLIVCASSASAGVILQDLSDSRWQIQFFEPIGQSFVAEDPNVLIAFSFADFNPSYPNEPLVMHLLEGDGVGGTEIASVAQLLTPGLGSNSLIAGEFVDFDFSAINLVVGNSYTALIDASNARWAVSGAQNSDPYANGNWFRQGTAVSGDLRFRITPVPTVPEPSIIGLLALGLLGVGYARRWRGA